MYLKYFQIKVTHTSLPNLGGYFVMAPTIGISNAPYNHGMMIAVIMNIYSHITI